MFAMSNEAPPKRESYTGWIVGVGLLLLIAAAIPTYQKLYGPRQHDMEITGDPGGQIAWRRETAGQTEPE